VNGYRKVIPFDPYRHSWSLYELLGRWSPPIWAHSRDPLRELPTPADSSRSSWFNTRPAPSNTLMSESAEQRRRRFQRHMLATFRSDTNDDMSLPTRSRPERLLEVDRSSRSVLIEDLNTSRSRSPREYNQRASDMLHMHLPRASHNPPSRWLPPSVDGHPHSGPTVHHIRSEDNLTNIDSPELLWQRRRERLISAESLRASPHIPPALGRLIPTYGSPSPTDPLHQTFESPDDVTPRANSNASRPVSDRPSLSAMFSPPWSHHPLPEVPLSRYQSPPINDDSPLPSTPEDPVPPPPSIYRDIDLNVYQHGPFRASLERFRAIDRVRDSLRSRLNQLDHIVNDGFSGRSGFERLRELRESGQLPEPVHGSLPRRERNITDYPNFTLPPMDLAGSDREVSLLHYLSLCYALLTCSR
jgi:hypothetical protein